MKIGLSTTAVELAAAGGISDGISHYTEQLGRALPQVGVTVVNYAFDRRLKHDTGRDLQFSRPIPGGFALLGAAGILTGGRARFFSPDVDVFHSTDFKVVPATCPIVATLWDAIPISHPEWISARARIAASFALKRVAHFADRIICASEHAAGDVVRHFGVKAARVSVVPWGIGEEWLAPPSPGEIEATLGRFGLQRGYILTVATIQPRKNIHRLLQAYAALPAAVRHDHKLVIVGRKGWGSDDVIALLAGMVERGEAVWLREGPSDRDVRNLYRAAHLFVLPSLHEGFGIPLLEAFASDIPVVSSNTTSLPEVSADAALEVDPHDVDALAEAMRVLATDTGERERRRALGARRAREMSVVRAAAETAKIYRLAASDR